MGEFPRTFSLVDRILAVEPGVRIRGRYRIPAEAGDFPASLVAEATGQLAAWSAMAALRFTRRPVAGLAGRIELLREVTAGQELELEAELDSADAEAVAYRGTAKVAGEPVLRLEHCVGPMVAVEEFDDPAGLRERFEGLCAGTTMGGFGGLPVLGVEPQEGEAGRVARGVLGVPTEAAIFADHFPRRAVFPGTLLMHVTLQLAAGLAREARRPEGGGSWRCWGISNVKLRAFTPPGERLELEARVQEETGEALRMGLAMRKGGRAVGSAQVEFRREEGV